MSNKFTLVLDSSQLTNALQCEQQWYNRYVKGLVPVAFTPEDENMNAGTYGHKLLDLYYRAKSRGLGLNQMIEQALSYNPDISTCTCGCPSEFHNSGPTFEECGKCQKCSSFIAKPFELSTEVRKKVQNRFREYVFKYQYNDIEPLSEQHVEVGFSEPLYEDSENLFVLEGRIDLIGKIQGLPCIMDHKFQGRTHWLYPKSIQLKNYMLVSKTPMAVLNYIRLQDKIQPDSLARELVTFNKVELQTWKDRLLGIYFKLKKSLETNDLERSWNNCGGGYKLTYDKTKPNYCWYASLCEEVDPNIALSKEQQLFKIQPNPWRPW